MTIYRWDRDSLHEAKEVFRPRAKNYNKIKSIVDDIKVVMKNEKDPETKNELANAGLTLNKILLR